MYPATVGERPRYTAKPFNQLEGANPPPFYSKGGRVNKRNLRDMAEMLRAEGTGGDSILAHINPNEAHELMARHGGNINPYTGLPEFGFLDKAFHFMEDKLPWITSLVGNFVGGPLGGVIGGTIGGALRSQAHDKNMFKGALKGAVTGGMTSAAAGAGNMLMGTGGSGIKGLLGMQGGPSTMGSMMGGHAGKSIGNLFASGIPSAGGSAGIGSAAMGAQPDAMNSLKSMLAGRQAQSAPSSSGGLSAMFGNLFGGGGDAQTQAESPSMMQSLMKNPLGLALLATAIGGTLGAKKERLKTEDEGPPTVYDINLVKAKGAPKPLRREYVPPPPGYRPGTDPEHVYYKDVNPATEYQRGGYIRGDSGGQDDDIHLKNADVSAGEFVMDSDITAMLGDGNNEAGARKFEKFRKNIRKHKRSAPINKIPPKAKSIEAYMRMK